jgi:hypothetical protein
LFHGTSEEEEAAAEGGALSSLAPMPVLSKLGRNFYHILTELAANRCPCRKLTPWNIGDAARPELAPPACDRQSARHARDTNKIDFRFIGSFRVVRPN